MKQRLFLLTALILLAPRIALSQCGEERWPVKTLLDIDTASINFIPVESSLEALDSLSKVSVNAATPRLPLEKQVVRIRATVLQMKRESGDNDIHLLLVDDAGHQMISEVPDPDGCSEAAMSGHSNEWREVRMFIKDNFGTPTTSFKDVDKTVVLTGIPFQDILHNQRGASRNQIELHPILSIQFPVDAVPRDQPLDCLLDLTLNPTSNLLHVKAHMEQRGKIYGFRVVDAVGNVLMRSTDLDGGLHVFEGDFRTDVWASGTYYFEMITTYGPFAKRFVVGR